MANLGSLLGLGLAGVAIYFIRKKIIKKTNEEVKVYDNISYPKEPNTTTIRSSDTTEPKLTTKKPSSNKRRLQNNAITNTSSDKRSNKKELRATKSDSQTIPIVKPIDD